MRCGLCPEASLAKVYMTGKEWRERWEDGEEGIFRIEDNINDRVKKTVELNDPELDMGEDIMKSLFARTSQKLLGSHSKLEIVDSSASSSTPAIMDVDAIQNRDRGEQLKSVFGASASAFSAKAKAKPASSKGANQLSTPTKRKTDPAAPGSADPKKFEGLRFKSSRIQPPSTSLIWEA